MKVGRVSSATPPLPADVRPRRVAVEHHDRRPHEQRRDERVPHHPGGRAEPEQAAARLQVPAERVRLEVLEQDAAVPVDDRLRPARRPRREEHEQRVVEGDRLERRAARARRAARPRPARPGPRARRTGTCTTWRSVGRAARIVATSSRRSTERSRKPYPPTVSSTVGLELREAVDDAARAELGRAARPDRAEARRRRERDQRLGDVRQVGDDAVARADAEPHEPGARARHLLAEVAERELGRLARLGVRDDRDLRRRPRRRRAGARRSSAARPGTTSRRASRRRRGRCCTGRAP